jgi:Flp pilus assembly protein TadD
MRFAWLLCLPLLTACGTLQNLSMGAESQLADTSEAGREKALYLDVIADLQKQRLHRAALAHLDEYDRRYGPSETSGRRRAEALLAVGEDAQAEREWLALLPKVADGGAYNGLGQVYARQGRWSEAQANFEAAVQREPTRAGYLNNLGYALFRAGSRDRAAFRLRQAEELDPASDAIRNNLVTVLFADGRAPEAEQRLEAVADRRQRDTIRRRAMRLAKGEEG